MPNNLEIIRDTMNEFKQIQDYMILAKKENASETYAKLKERYDSLKALLEIAGVNMTEIDRIKM